MLDLWSTGRPDRLGGTLARLAHGILAASPAEARSCAL